MSAISPVDNAAVRRRRWWLWIALPFYALLFGELFIRIFMPTAIIPRYVTGTNYGVRAGMPNMSFPQTSAEMQVELRTNSRGIRADREYSYDKPLGVCRIILLGDSLFVGFEVNLEDSFAHLLGQKLVAAGYQCEVINLAVSGFGTAEMLVTLQNEGLKYQPDIVVFSSHATDLDDNLRSSLYALNGRGELIRQNAAFLPGIEVSDFLSRFKLYRFVVEHSQLYSAVRERAAYYVKTVLVSIKTTTHAGAASADGQAPIKSSEPPYAHRLHLRLLQEAKRLTEANHARFCVLEIPVNVSRTKFARKLPEYSAQTMDDLHVFSPLAAFQAAADPSRKLFYEKAHGHLTPEGNRLLTEFFYSKLMETGWLHK